MLLFIARPDYFCDRDGYLITSENLMFYGKIYLIWVLLTLLMNFVSEFRWELINNPHHKHQVNSQSQWFSFAFAAAITPRNH